MPIRTKVICTIGPSCRTFDMMLKLIQAGMNVARLNFSHGSHAEHLESLQNLKEARQQLKVPVAIMLDTKGPEIRLGKLKENQIYLDPGHKWLLVKEAVEGDNEKVSVLPPHVLDKLTVGTRVLFDDGYISSLVTEMTSDGVLVEIQNAGGIRSGKGINIPNVSLDLPAVTPKDIEDIRFGCKNDVDYIAASFVRSPEHILDIRKILLEENKGDIQIIAKIENSEGLQNFDSIVQVADGIMIARGDLGVEVPLSQVPKLQKMMIRKSNLAGKPVVTATQMLESMIHNPRPTRAEASDVANAIYDSTSAVMLSGETAIGKYPLEAVNMMKSIAQEAEQDFDYRMFFEQFSKLLFRDVTSAVTSAAVKTAYSSDCKAIFSFTSRGTSSRLLSRLHPSMPIICLTQNEKTFNQMALNWGVIPVFHQESRSFTDSLANLSVFAVKNNLVEYGDLVVVTAGTPFGISGTTNLMVVESIGEVIVRGEAGSGVKVQGNVSFVLSPEMTQPKSTTGCLIVLTRCDENYLPFLQEAKGIILQNHISDVNSEKYLIETAKSLDKPYIVRAEAATNLLKEGQFVTLDPQKASVYKS